MKNTPSSFILLAVAIVSTSLLAGEFNPTLNIGDAVPDWTGLPGTDGKAYSLADFKNKDVLVIAVTCNSCPYAVDCEDRLLAFAKEYCGAEGKAALVAINANKVPEDSPEEMKKRAEKKGFTFPYLFDEKQSVAKSLGATSTPEFFVFDKDRKLVYTGAFDDGSSDKPAKRFYVIDATKAALAGEKPLVAETQAIGCLVRYEKTRRTKQK